MNRRTWRVTKMIGGRFLGFALHRLYTDERSYFSFRTVFIFGFAFSVSRGRAKTEEQQ